MDEDTGEEEFYKYGIIQYTVKRVTKHPKDDFELGIAYNDYLEKDIDDYLPSEEGRDTNIARTLNVSSKEEPQMDIELKDEKGKRKRGGSIW